MVHIDYISRNMKEIEDPTEDRMFAFLGWDNSKNQLRSLEEIIKEQKFKKKDLTIGYTEKEGILYYRWKILPPEKFRNRIIHACHSLFPYTHLGQQKTCKKIQTTFNWPNLIQDVATYIAACLIC